MNPGFPRAPLLQVGPLMPALEAALRERHVVLMAQDLAAATPLAQVEVATRVEAVVTSAPVGLPAHWLPHLPALRVVSSFGVGLDRLPLDACATRGVPVGYTPDVLNDCVADLAMGLLLGASRQIAAADRFVRRGDWTRGRYPVTTRASGKRLGILGLGRIGQAIARRAAGFDMAIAYTQRSVNPQVAWRHEPSLLALAEWADFLVIAVAGGPQTRHLVNEAVLQALGPQGFVVNVARGSVVDETALIACLRDGRLGGAGLDVFENEPQVPAELQAMEQVVLAPHMASGTRETRQAMADMTLANLAAGLAGLALVARA